MACFWTACRLRICSLCAPSSLDPLSSHMAPAPTYAAVSINTLDDLITASTTARQTPPNSEGHHFIASAIAAAVRKFTKAAASSRTGDHALRGSLSDGSDPLAVLMAPTTATETGAGAGRAATAKFGLAGMAILCVLTKCTLHLFR